MKLILSILIVVGGVLLLLFVLSFLCWFYQKKGHDSESAFSYSILTIMFIFILCSGVYNVYILFD